MNNDKLIKTLGNAYRWLLDLFLPPQCVVCGRVETWLCDVCAQDLPLFRGPCCPSCGRPWTASGLCPVCQTNPLRVSPVRSALLFKPGPIRDVIHALKYRGSREIVTPLAVRMAEAWEYFEMQCEILIPVPLYARREARRGYNQATLLAVALGKQIGIPVVSDALARVRATQSQTKLNSKERKKNVKGAFAWTSKLKLDGVSVTLVDDVATTGATLEACANVLLDHGVESVSAFTLARAA
ncbi:MAG: ComF family protein [Anaerolineae bacterium]|nr:ComF family protein [Anaerolineae bacterium]